MKPNWKTALAATVVAAATLAGCVVPSLSPLFEDKDALFEPALLGKWVKDKESFEFTRVGDKNEYRIVNKGEKGETAILAAQFGKIGDKSYLCAALDGEAMPENGRWFTFPGHCLIFRVEQTAPELKLIMLDFEACKKLLTEKPATIAHVMLKPEDAKEKDAIPFLTASPASLQKFIAEYGDKAGLFPEKQTLTLTRPAAEKPAAAKTSGEK